ncbi:pyridoxal phosphate-dependent aminotransferase [Methylobrevis pamukkalensis]|uniref:aspartate transaminase n=1 Tax=Methylobrevis pamukkalensis TaxID=1439726 RepID=A0A1E3HA37_9HYPH|nr:pyridoxal phosphate-dependent aminotransferase [Methylobrevis pamukkalensis]ODN72341.1 Aspartate aminotransferase [Methylobrevis pamukkalensis]
MSQDFASNLRQAAVDAPPSGIVEVMNHGFGRPGLVALWAGEGDLPTPAFICEAATRSLVAGETFYTRQTGIPELREALARYHDRNWGALAGRPFDPERFIVTASGMQAIQIAIAAIAGAGDEILVPTPAWPNVAGALAVAGGRPVEVPMTCGPGGWHLDLDLLAAAITPATRAIFVNSPSNPTGWTADLATLQALLDLARARGLWILADEVYARFVYDGSRRAPSFYDLIEADDRVIFVNTLSKNWAMTGWRVGWISAPPQLAGLLANLVQYSTSGVAVFLQRAAAAALDRGDAFIDHQVARARRGRDIIHAALTGSGRVHDAPPPGAFYYFFAIDGEPDTRRLGLRLVDEANVGLAPGTAFGAAGAGYMRLCFARGEESLTLAAGRLRTWLDAGGRTST